MDTVATDVGECLIHKGEGFCFIDLISFGSILFCCFIGTAAKVHVLAEGIGGTLISEGDGWHCFEVLFRGILAAGKGVAFA